jgi:hypothetical protein
MKISWTDRVRSYVLCTVTEKWNILPKIRKRKDNWISHNWRRIWLLIHVIEVR